MVVEQATEFLVIVEEAPETVSRRVSVRVTGDIDLQEAEELERHLVGAFDSGASEVAVDLSGVTFMGSAGLSALIRGHRRAEESDGRLVVRNPSPIVRKVVEITAVDRAIPVETD